MSIKIISPHIDDAVFSLGGSIIDWIKNEEQVEIIDVFSLSAYINPTNLKNIPVGKDWERITARRKNEEKRVCELLNCSLKFLDFEERSIRKTFTEDAQTKYMLLLRNTIEKEINKDKDMVYFPLSFNCNHIDHNMITTAAEQIKCNKYFYEEMPYPSFHYANILEETFKILRTGKFYNVNQIDINKKIEIIKLYESQIDENIIERIKAYGYWVKDNSHYERIWQ